MKQKPIIGITCNFDEREEIGIITTMGVAQQKWQFLADNYINSVERAGGIPVIIPICENFETVRTLLQCLDGIIISGGNDVSPECYGEMISNECGTLSTPRDSQDIAIVSYLLEKDNIPVLGICRGMQVLNVAAGGTLYQDLCIAGYRDHSFDESPMNHPVHMVHLKKGTKLYGIFGRKTLPVNSYHHSAVGRIAKQFIASGQSEEGVMEAMELPGHPFFAAVQWHPEMMFDDVKQQALFQAFIKTCTNKGNNS